jgi:hypothetical protein
MKNRYSCRYSIRAIAHGLCGVLLAGGAAFAGEGEGSARGAALLMPFKKDLMATLTAGLAAGMDEAIAACNTQAPGIAARYSVDGVVLGRASHRLRNPANAAPDWVAPVLDDYLVADTKPEARVVEISAGRTGYVEPIFLGPQCLGCHGENLSPDVSDRLAELYPDDRATGFAAGDLRGVFWVEYPQE